MKIILSILCLFCLAIQVDADPSTSLWFCQSPSICGSGYLSEASIAGLPNDLLNPALNFTASSNVYINSNGVNIAGMNYPAAPLGVGGKTNNPLQIVLQNFSTGTSAAGEYILESNLGGNTSYYAGLGINGSNFNQAGFSAEHSTDVFLESSDSQIDIEANVNGTSQATNGNILFMTNGANSANVMMAISSGSVTLMNGSTLAVQGQAFSVGGSTFNISGGSMILNGNDYRMAGTTIVTVGLNFSTTTAAGSIPALAISPSNTLNARFGNSLGYPAGVIWSSAPGVGNGVQISSNIVFSTFSMVNGMQNIGDALFVRCESTATANSESKNLTVTWTSNSGVQTNLHVAQTSTSGSLISTTWFRKGSTNIITAMNERINTANTPTNAQVFDTSTGTVKIGCMGTSISGMTGFGMEIVHYPNQ